MSDLTEFLLARIAEDEAEAANHAVWRMNPTYGVPAYQAIRERVLAECEAKRRIVSDCSNELSESGTFGPWMARSVLHLLALPYADHPDYSPEWRP